MYKNKKSTYKKREKPISNLPAINTNHSISKLFDQKDSPKDLSYSNSVSTISYSQSINLMSPNSQGSFVKSLQSKVDVSTSLLSKIAENIPKSRSLRRLKDGVSSVTSPKNIESVLAGLKEVHQTSGLSQNLFNLFESLFQDIIEKDKLFGSILREIKRVYDEWIGLNYKSTDDYLSLRKDLSDSKTELEKKTEENRKNTKMIQILSAENLKLGKSLQVLNESYEVLALRMKNITEVNIDNIPNNKESWKALVAGNSEYSELCKELCLKLKDYENREKVYQKTFSKLKNSGIKIEMFLPKASEMQNTSLSALSKKSEKGKSRKLEIGLLDVSKAKSFALQEELSSNQLCN